MNYKLIIKLIGNMLIIEALFMVLSFIVSLIYGGEDMAAFLWSVLIVLVLGFAMSRIKIKDRKFGTKDAFAAAAISWFIISLFGALPFYFSGYFNSFIDCMFESISGFTTTGATILTDVESLPKGIAFWRSFSHWIGGMGVFVFMLAVMPSMNASSINLLKAESTGPSIGRIVPRVRETAKVMYLIYLAMTIVLIILLIASGFPVFDSFTHAFSVAGTGGFSNMNASVGAYNNVAAEIIMSVFMFLFGINFTLYFYLYKGDLKQIVKDDELRLYFGLVLAAIIIVTIDISGIYGSVSQALRYSSFQISSVITTSGFLTTDHNSWPTLSHVILILLMFTGSCAGSTSGGIKLVRILILFKAVKTEIVRVIHPRSVKAVTINGKRTENDIVLKVAVFFFTYFMILFVALMLLSLEGRDLTTSLLSIVSMLSNVGHEFGPGLSVGNFAEYSLLSKFTLSFCMLAGRLEFFPVLVLFAPSVWKGKLLNNG